MKNFNLTKKFIFSIIGILPFLTSGISNKINATPPKLDTVNIEEDINSEKDELIEKLPKVVRSFFESIRKLERKKGITCLSISFFDQINMYNFEPKYIDILKFAHELSLQYSINLYKDLSRCRFLLVEPDCVLKNYNLHDDYFVNLFQRDGEVCKRILDEKIDIKHFIATLENEIKTLS